jgi:predicted anti-sigma-YlaC factor YlaD
MIAEENLNCSELLNLVIDGQATKEQEVVLMEHVQKCKQCKEEFELNTSITSSLKSRLQKINTPKDLSASIQSKIFELAS